MMCMMKGICSSRLCSACSITKLIDPSSNPAWQHCCLFAECMDIHSLQIKLILLVPLTLTDCALPKTENNASADAAGITPRQFQGACVQTALFVADDYRHPDQSRLDLHNEHLVCLHLSNTSAAVCHVTLWC